jgi:hypothetical protein
MRLSTRCLAIAAFAPLATLAVPPSARAQSSDTLSLQGKSFFAFGVGLTGPRDARNAGATQTVHASGQLASMSFTHFARPSLAIDLSTAVLDVDAVDSPAVQRANAIIPVLLGVSYSPRALAISRSIRPYASIAAGPYIHTVAQSSFLGQSAATEVVPGARAGAGVNWYVARHFLLQLEGNYHAIGRFGTPDPATRNPGGFGVSAGFGLGWGGS